MNDPGNQGLSMSENARVSGQLTPTPQTLELTLAEALAHYEADRLAEAQTRLRRVLAIDPEHTDAMHLLGLVANRQGQYETATELIMAAITRKPQALYYFNLGNVMQSNNRPAAAAECFRQAIAMQPDHVDAHNNLGNALRALKKHEAAMQSFCNAINLAPEHAQAYNNLANTLMELDELDAAIEAYRSAIALRPDFAEPHSNLLFALNYLASTTPQQYLDEALRFAAQIRTRAKPWKDWLVDDVPRTGRPLRVGIVSGDLKRHPVGYFIESVVAELDPTRIELIAYPTRTLEDDLTARIKPCFSAWTSIAGMSDEAAAQHIRNDRIDVLLDGAGHTIYNRLPLFAWKPAPVQVSWPGFFACTGLDTIDYVLGDRHVLPVEEESHFIEKPWRLPDSYLCFTPPQDDAQVSPLPMLTNDHVTFGYFGQLAKMTDQVVALWARLLHAVPNAKLFLKAEQLDTAHVRETTLRRFAAHRIDASRLILEGRSPRAEYLAAYNRVDIALSPFPYPGGTTTAEALWMGVPVLCRRGDRFLSHICESFLHSAGLDTWIATDDEDYLARAIAFAADRAGLAALRAGLREQVVASPLCDAPRFARNLEAALHDMWAQHVTAVQEVAE
ncbi:Predicted O-linked N-acetylglucosamine transferase, SPINDLY family [Paraburkholderia sartisoli]|uniref:protein O-GlcNAc transferase n=2 Tax=Paraburkholderia sartisoli TaxID=83784 RepID=A0A1H4G1C1_9BURK|nr:Predicted O-linked N-acetylglucosamine transferase, SPINDLY family [Paraburkholderia sartisoli]